MAFSLGSLIESKNHGVLKGVQTEVACDCWFTSRGESIPKIIKIMNSNGEIYTIKHIQVLCREEKNFSGIETVEHICKIRVNNRLEIVKLIFTKENCKWTLIKI